MFLCCALDQRLAWSPRLVLRLKPGECKCARLNVLTEAREAQGQNVASLADKTLVQAQRQGQLIESMSRTIDKVIATGGSQMLRDTFNAQSATFEFVLDTDTPNGATMI